MNRVRAVVAAAIGICATVGLTVGVNASDAASQGSVFTVIHTNDAPPDGVLFRSSPHVADRIPDSGVYPHEWVALSCYEFGDPVGPYGNKLWYRVSNVSRPLIHAQPNSGFLNSHYINDGEPLNHIDRGIAACGASSSQQPTLTPRTTTTSTPTPRTTTVAPTSTSSKAVNPPAPSPVRTTGTAPGQGSQVDGVTLGKPLGAPQLVGNCSVREFAIASTTSAAAVAEVATVGGRTHLVRGGQLTGWNSSGGASGALGCPVTGEQASVSVQQRVMVTQQFLGGYQYWTSGMSAAVQISLSTVEALRWSWDCLALANCAYTAPGVGPVKNYYGFSLAFVYDAYRLGADKTPVGFPVNRQVTAQQWWAQDSTGTKVAGNTSAPPGTFVVWSAPSPQGGGHIALSVGGGWAVSSWDGGQQSVIHLFQISSLDPGCYLGYVSSGV